MTAVEAWFLGGPADGRFMAVEISVGDGLPDVVRLPESGVYVGTGDQSAPTVEHIYVRADGPDGDLIYKYRQSAPRIDG